jgi:tetratricopeptide (TPR) repeat protein
MKKIFLALAAVPLMGMGPTGATVTIGGGSASSCYRAAVAHDISTGALNDCNAALNHEVLSQDNEVASYVNRGILHLLRTDYPNAEADFSRAMSMQPNQAEAWLNMAIAHYRQGRSESAAKMFERSIELRTERPAIAYFGRALAREDRGDIKGAYADLQRANELQPAWDAPVNELKRFRVLR